MAGVVTVFVTRRILRPINEVRRTTRRLASGHYDERVVPPAELELAALATDVNQLAEALETTERRRVQLVSEVAHEMRTPLTTIGGYVEGMLDGVFEPSEQVLTAVSEETSRSSDSRPISPRFRRAEENVLQLREDARRPVRPRSCCHVAAATPFDDKGVALEIEDGRPLHVDVDRDRILQVLTTSSEMHSHLYAIRWTGRRPSGTPAAQFATVSVADTGVGIAAEDLGLVFERFCSRARPPASAGR